VGAVFGGGFVVGKRTGHPEQERAIGASEEIDGGGAGDDADGASAAAEGDEGAAAALELEPDEAAAAADAALLGGLVQLPASPGRTSAPL
jgi:hypothetical protein